MAAVPLQFLIESNHVQGEEQHTLLAPTSVGDNDVGCGIVDRWPLEWSGFVEQIRGKGSSIVARIRGHPSTSGPGADCFVTKSTKNLEIKKAPA